MSPSDTALITRQELSDLLNLAISRDPMAAFFARKLSEMNEASAPVAGPLRVVEPAADQPFIDPA